VDEVVNLVALWKQEPTLYSDIPIPTTTEIELLDLAERDEARLRLVEIEDKLTRAWAPKPRQRLEEQRVRAEERLKRPVLVANVRPTILEAGKLLKLEQTLNKSVLPQLFDRNLNPVKRRQLELKAEEIHQRFLQHEMGKAIEREMWRRQREYIRRLTDAPGDVGMLIEEVDPDKRLAFVKSKGVLFSIAKYGKEGLDNPDLDTLMVLEPFASRNILQQYLGRPSRRRVGKMTSVVVILEDNIGPLIGMCVKLRRHLREWPADEGGPFTFELVGHPPGQRRQGCKKVTEAFRPGLW
jgi:superfamily II DNA or RNA helicase